MMGKNADSIAFAGVEQFFNDGLEAGGLIVAINVDIIAFVAI